LFNPITGRKMVKTWKADELFPFLRDFYAKMEQNFSAKFLHYKATYRPFFSVEEQNEWMGKWADPAYGEIIDEIKTKPSFGERLQDPFGGLVLKNTGYLDIPVFLNASKAFWKAKSAFIEKRFDENAVEFNEDYIRWDGLEAQKLIYCSGIAAAKSKYFEWLPFHPLKGEVLELDTQLPDDEIIFNRGVFLFKDANYKIKCGSTYEWRKVNLEPTAEARNELLEKLLHIFKSEVIVKNHWAGIRPSTFDRRPFIGMHPEKKLLGIFNGLGTKGVSLAPWFAVKCCDYLVRGSSLDETVSISRYFSLYWKAK
jgi:glycine oxidase